jgi:pilus assembly protein CpaC
VYANRQEKQKALNLIKSLIDKVDIVDLSKVDKKHASPQINLRVRVVEMDRTVKRALGLNFGLNFKTSNTDIRFESPALIAPEGAISKILVGSETSPGLLFGNFSLWSLLNIMSDENLITSLAEPNIILVPNEKASFLFGGEVPINNAAGLGGTSAVDYRDYGIKIDAVAQILDNNFIRIKLSPSISKLSDANSIVVNNSEGQFKIQGFVTRKIDTTIELKSGQSIALAGLIESESVQNEAHIPGLDKVPVIADLTRQEGVYRKETEVVFIVTPYIVKPSGNNDLASPVHHVNGLPKGKLALGKPGFIIG